MFPLLTMGEVSDLPNMRYCAHIESSSGSGSHGWFAMEIDQSTSSAKYKFNVDFTGYTGTCDITQGVNYHIHKDWQSTDGASTTQCGPSFTGGHYDPNFACGPASAYASSMCSTMGRSTSDYNCLATGFGSGNFSSCELGDLSGKFGYAMPNNDLVIATSTLHDPTGPYVANYDDNTDDAWYSIVWHCKGSNDARFLCAKLSSDNNPQITSFCTANGGYDDNSAEDDSDYVVSYSYTKAQLVEAIIISIVLSIALTLICYASSVFCAKKEEPAKNQTIIVHHGNDGMPVQRPYAPEVQPQTPPPVSPMHKI